MTAELPHDKLTRYSSDVEKMLGKQKTNVRELQQIIGKLQFATCVVPIGKPFLRRLIDPLSGKTQFASVKITKSIQSDLRMWAQFLKHYNGISVVVHTPPCTSDSIFLTSDASNLGYAGTYGRHWIQGKWTPQWTALNIAVRELYPIVVLVHMY